MKNYLNLKNKSSLFGLKKAAKIIKNGGLVLFPTETVYGIGANGLNSEAVRNIFVAKGRNSDNPLILHISSMKMLTEIAQNISNLEYKLMKEFWPGPFTIILKRKNNVPDVVTGGLDTVGVRMPSNKIAKKLIHYSGVPIAAPSANISGRPSGTNVEDIISELSDKVDFIIDNGNCSVGLESTVVCVIDEIPTILRPGKITPEQIKNVAGCVKVDGNILHKVDTLKAVLSPGMKYRHYAPKSNCVLVYNDNNDFLLSKILELASNYKNPVIVCSSENAKKVPFDNIIDMGNKNNLDEIARNIFTDLRKVDKFNPDIVIIEGVKEEGLGLAIMNRLLRACNFNYIKE